jgi:hypothetical protein
MKKINYYLIACAGVASGILWINVFSLFHRGVLAYIGGIPAGVAIVGLVVYAANSLPRVQSRRARGAGWGVLILLGIVEPVVLGFANYPVVMGTAITQTGGMVVSGGASLAITLALVLGSLVDRSLIPAEKQEKQGAKQKKQKKAKPEAEVVAPAVAQSAFRCATCDFEAKSQKALNGHQRKHKRITGYAVSFEPITKEQAKQ